MENLRMHVFAELHQNEPVPEVKLLHDQPDVLPPAGLCPAAEDENTRGPDGIFWDKNISLIYSTHRETMVTILKQKKMQVQPMRIMNQNQRNT